MAAAIYWDTSALLKLYAPEADSSDYRRLLISRPEPVAISSLHMVELYYALIAKEVRGEIIPHSAQILFQSFQRHVRSNRYAVISIEGEAMSLSRQVLDQCHAATPTIHLRSLDGLHLGAMRAASISQLVTTDARMQTAALAVSIATISP